MRRRSGVEEEEDEEMEMERGPTRGEMGKGNGRRKRMRSSDGDRRSGRRTAERDVKGRQKVEGWRKEWLEKKEGKK